MMEHINAVVLMMKRECVLCYRRRNELINPIFFFIVVTCLFPLATTPNNRFLHVMGAGIIWVAALLATLLSLPRLFQEDCADGSLDVLLMSRFPLSVLLFIKIIAQWLLFSIPLILISPLLALMYHLSATVIVVLMLSLLLGTLTLMLLGAIGSALTVGLRNNGMLLALLVLPLFIPTLIFGASAPLAVEQGMAVSGIFAILGALLMLAIILAPIATAFAIRIGVNYHR